jgi:hypothetical protein
MVMEVKGPLDHVLASDGFVDHRVLVFVFVLSEVSLAKKAELDTSLRAIMIEELQSQCCVEAVIC